MGPFLKSLSDPAAAPRPYVSIQKPFHKGPLVAGSTASINAAQTNRQGLEMC